VNIALIGFRGTGKTTVCRLLAKRLGKKLISTDEETEKKTKLSIEKFVKKYNWDKFREAEAEVIESICDFDECIFDTGGGIVMRNENIVNLKKNALIVLLTADIRTIANRLKNSKMPALTKGAKGNYLDEIKEVMQERETRYEKAADYAIDTSGLIPEEVCNLIAHYVQMEMI